jgi:hypothetical protein
MNLQDFVLAHQNNHTEYPQENHLITVATQPSSDHDIHALLPSLRTLQHHGCEQAGDLS